MHFWVQGRNQPLVSIWKCIHPLRIRQMTAQLMMTYDVTRDIRHYQLGTSSLITVGHANPYGIGQSNIIHPIRCRTERYKSSFLPSSILMLNDKLLSADPDILTPTLESSSKLHVIVSSKLEIHEIFMYELIRWSLVLLTCIRCKNSDLKVDLYDRSLCEDHLYEECSLSETVKHFCQSMTRYVKNV